MADDVFDDEWRELGFYCNHDTANREYRLIGSATGLRKFADLLRAYVADPRNEMQSEHEHYGPWGLEVMTWPDAGMDDHAIHGPLPKLAELAVIVDSKLADAKPGDRVVIRGEYSPNCEFSLVLDVREPGFDPPSAMHEQ
jgi:hypothetical protein